MPVKGEGKLSSYPSRSDVMASSGMEELVWEQYTVTLQRDSKMGFGIAVSGGRDNPNVESGETSIIVSDVLAGGPADGLLFENDRVIQVNAITMDNVPHSFAVQSLRKCGRVAKITVKRPRKVSALSQKQPPSPSRTSHDFSPSTHYYDADTDNDWYRNESRDPVSDNKAYLDLHYRGGRDHNQRGRSRGRSQNRSSPSPDRERRDGRGGRERDSSDTRQRFHSRGRSPGGNHMEEHYERGDAGGGKIGRYRSRDQLNEPEPEPLEKPVNVLLVKNRPSEEYGLRLGSQIFIKQMTNSGLAAKDGNLQEGDIILKINGTVTENLSLHDAGKLIEKSRGKLELVVQRDRRQILVRIPPLADSDSDNDDMSDEESYQSYSPPEERRSQQSDLSSHSSNERDDPTATAKMSAMASPFRVPEDLHPSAEVETGSPRTDRPPGVVETATPKIILRPSPEEDKVYGLNTVMVAFQKGDSVGLRLAGGNDVGIFIAGVQDGSPAKEEGLRVGDQILKVNNVDFQGLVREEAVLFLLEIPKGDLVSILAQSKPDVYQDILSSGRGDCFFIRTHFEYEKETAQSLAFCRGHIFKVVDTLYDGQLGKWLALRVGKDQQLLEKGLIPNKSRAEQMASVQSSYRMAQGDRADFWRLRGKRSLKKKDLRKGCEPWSCPTLTTRFPAYERVVLREAGFRRPVVLFGPIADAATEKLASEMPDLFVIAKTEPKDAGSEKSSGVVRLNTIRQIIEQDKHALLDVTPKAVDTLNYNQWYPIVIFFNPDSKTGIKALRQRLAPHSHRSARKLYEQAVKMRKTCSHLFTATVDVNSINDAWYGCVKDLVREQQMKAVWVSDGKLEGVQGDLDCQDLEQLSYLSSMSADYLSMDSRLTSDLDDTADEGGAYTDNEPDLETAHISAIGRSSEPVSAEEILRRYSPDIRSRSIRLSSQEGVSRSSPPPGFLPDNKDSEGVYLALAASLLHIVRPNIFQIFNTSNRTERDLLAALNSRNQSDEPYWFKEVKLSLREDPLLLGSTNLHHRQLPHKQPHSNRSYDSPSSSSPTSSNNDPPSILPPPPLPLHLSTFSNLLPQRPPSSSKPPGCGNSAETPIHSSPVVRRHHGGAENEGLTEDPSTKSFLGKIKAFEKMDHFARAQRMLELQQAHKARLELSQKHPDIYAVPLKTAKLDHSRPQPIGSSCCPDAHIPPPEEPPGYFTASSHQYNDTEL